jgi:hypothetical protein
MINKFLLGFKDFFSDKDDPNEPHYDPVHIGAMIVLVLFVNTVIFWLLWAFLVFGGGLQAKIVPALLVLFAKKTAADFGYIGYPYEMGIFEGWITNIVAFVLLIAALIAGWMVFNNKKQDKSQ